MTSFKQEILSLLLEAEDAGLNSNDRGKMFEELLIKIFGSVKNALVVGNITSDFASEQIDIAVSNRGGFPGLPSEFLVECKNYSAPLDSKAVGYFLFICVSRGAKLAVIVAKSGLTGDPGEHTHALSLAKAAAALDCRLVILNREDLVSLGSPEELVELLEMRHLQAFANGGVGH